MRSFEMSGQDNVANEMCLLPLVGKGLHRLAKASCPLLPWLAEEPLLRRPCTHKADDLPQVSFPAELIDECSPTSKTAPSHVHRDKSASSGSVAQITPTIFARTPTLPKGPSGTRPTPSTDCDPACCLEHVNEARHHLRCCAVEGHDRAHHGRRAGDAAGAAAQSAGAAHGVARRWLLETEVRNALPIDLVTLLWRSQLDPLTPSCFTC